MTDTSYISWKSWATGDFCVCPLHLRRYYKRLLAKAAIRRAHNQTRILEIGFGNGSFLGFAALSGYSISCTEINQSLLSLAIQSGFDVIEDPSLLTCESSSYDAVVAFDVLEHIDVPSIDQLLSSIYRILAANGVLIARFPNGDSPFGLEAQNGDPTHLNAIGVGKIKYWARKHHFSIDYLGGDLYPVPSGSIALTLRRIASLPLMFLLDWIVSTIFLPGSGVSFSSRNLICILRKK